MSYRKELTRESLSDYIAVETGLLRAIEASHVLVTKLNDEEDGYILDLSISVPAMDGYRFAEANAFYYALSKFLAAYDIPSTIMVYRDGESPDDFTFTVALTAVNVSLIEINELTGVVEHQIEIDDMSDNSKQAVKALSEIAIGRLESQKMLWEIERREAADQAEDDLFNDQD